jgi:hypothetical protein
MIYPMFTMVLLTFIIGFAAMRARIASVKMKEINIGYYRLMQAQVTQNIPERVTVTTRSFNNMFEIPVLFYIAGTLSLALDQVTTFSLIIAWGFVLSRIFHTWIHLGYNNILHRMNAYWIGLILVFILWIEQVYLTM